MLRMILVLTICLLMVISGTYFYLRSFKYSGVQKELYRQGTTLIFIGAALTIISIIYLFTH